MKKIYLKSVALVAFMALSTNVMANDIYVSASGNDANSGASADQALATLNAAVEKAISGDVIKVTGTVKVSETVFLDSFGSLTIEGTGSVEDCRLDGQNKVQILNVLNTDLTLKNLTLRRGKVEAEKNARGGAMWCRGKAVTISGCVFERNNTPYRQEDNGGAIFCTDGTLNIFNSEFNQNAAYRGGAIEAQVSTLNISNTTFSKNNTFADEATSAPVGQANGGALAIGKCWTKLTYVTIKENGSQGRGGAIKIWTDDQEGKYFTLESCAIIDNEGGGPGGAFSLDLNKDGNFQLNVRSTTISGNHTTGAGGVLCIENATSNPAQELNFVNCTITGNYTANNTGNSGGFMSHGGSKLQAHLNFVNTILEGNYSSQGWADARFARGVAESGGPDYVYVWNTIIGHAFQDANDGDLTNVWDSDINTTMQPRENPLTAGLVADIVEDCYPLLADSRSLTMGSLAKAAEFGVTRDQKGQLWTRPYLGAVQLVEGDQIPAVPSGIVEVNAEGRQPQVREGIYTMNGVRVERATKGLYIYNGKKIVLK